MSDPTVDREAWAAEVRNLLDREAKGNKSQFARMVGLKSVKTIDRWLARTVNVSSESVSQVARALNLSAVDLLTKVGYLEQHEGYGDLRAELVHNREVSQFIQEQADVAPHLRRQIEASLAELIAEQQRALMQQAERMIELVRRQSGHTS